jgi:hypothetical protein
MSHIYPTIINNNEKKGCVERTTNFNSSPGLSPTCWVTTDNSSFCFSVSLSVNQGDWFR